MPANLPPQYFEAEKRLRLAGSPQEKISILQDMLRIMPHHKGTDRLRAELNTKIAKLNKELQKKKGTRVYSYHIKKEGIGQVLLLGWTNSGKSKLLRMLTNATPDEVQPRVAEYPFTTTSPVIRMMQFEDVQIQLVELPALNHEFTRRWLGSLIYTCDLMVFVVDLSKNVDIMDKEVWPQLEEIRMRGKKVLVVGNKLDLPGASVRLEQLEVKALGKLNVEVLGVSAETGDGLDKLKSAIYSGLGVIRVYTKEPGRPPDLSEPIVLPNGSTVIDAARLLHKDFASGLDYARIWGKKRGDLKFSGKRAGREQELEDGDVIEFHL